MAELQKRPSKTKAAQALLRNCPQTYQIILYKEGGKIDKDPCWDHKEHSVTAKDVQQPEVVYS